MMKKKVKKIIGKEKFKGFEIDNLLKLAEDVEEKAMDGDEESIKIIEQANKEWGVGEYVCE